MEWIFLEALLALVLAVLIVWWTMPSRKRKPSRDDAHDVRPQGTDKMP
jgi:hypothetical protein